MAVNRANVNVAYGITNALQSLPPQPIISQRDPTGRDQAETGTLWINSATNEYWINTSTSNGQTNWQAQDSSTGVFTSVDITGTTGVVLSVATGGDTELGGDLAVLGTSTFDGNVTVNGDITFEGALIIDSADPITLETSAAGTGAFTLETTNATGDIQLIGDGGISLTSANTAIALASGTGAINIGTDAAAKTVTVGNVTGATAVNINSGTGGAHLASTGAGDITLTSADTVLIDSAGVLELNSSAGAINIGNDAVAQAINVGTGAAARAITVGNATGATSLTLRSGVGDVSVISTDAVLIDSAGALELNSSAGVIGIGNDAVAQNINIGTGAAARTLTIGNGTAGTSVSIDIGGVPGILTLGANATNHATIVGSTTAGSTLQLNTPTGTNVSAVNGVQVVTSGRGLTLPGSIVVRSGAGDPNGAVTAAAGSLFLRTDPAGATSRAYINTDSGTTWTNITCAA